MVMVGPKVIEEINGVNVLTERVKRRRRECLDARPHVTADRSALMTQVWKETEGEPLVIRRAKAFKKVIEEIPIVIRSGELVIGSQTEFPRGAYPYLDFTASAMRRELQADKLTVSGDNVEGVLDPGDKDKLLQHCNFWEKIAPGDIAERLFRDLWGDRIDHFTDTKLWREPHDRPPSGRTADFGKVLNKGLKDIMVEVKQELAKLNVSSRKEFDKLMLLKSALIVCEGMVTYAARYADLARKQSQSERDQRRARELLRLVEICEWVPANPARDFREAVQSFWFTLLALHLESAIQGEAPGRFDQYMYPFYERDISEGILTRQDAAELLGCLWVKMLEMTTFKSIMMKKDSQGSEFINVTLAGQDREGKDATNELSYLVLEVARQVKGHQPHVSVRYHDGLPNEYFTKAVQTNRDIGGGIPAFFNDKVAVEGLVRNGIPLSEARDWAPQGCVERCTFPSASLFSAGPFYNLPKILEITLNDGIDPRTGRLIGVRTEGVRNCTSFEQFYDYFKRQHAYFVDCLVEVNNVWQVVRAENYRLPFHSVLMPGCLEEGLDIVEGGGRWQKRLSNALRPFGHANLVNSLAAIKKLIFEEKQMTLNQLIDALAVDFKGHEGLRRKLLNAPKYGNDDDYVDDMMRDLWAWCDAQIKDHHSIYGERYLVSRQGVTLHYPFGKATGALPDGRKAGEPLADGSLSPMRGTDFKGPTAVINSALKVDAFGSEGTLLNQKMHPASLASQEGIDKLQALIKTYFNSYGYHIQFNILDPEVLLDAKRHPEKYPDLIVRVAGFSARFIELAPEVQDEIIERTMQKV